MPGIDGAFQTGGLMTACTERLSFVQDSRHQPPASNRKHDMTSSVGFSNIRAVMKSTQRFQSWLQISNLALYLASNLKATGTKWEQKVLLPWVSWGTLGLHMLHLRRVPKSHHSYGRAACWLMHCCSLLGPAGAAVSAFLFCRTVAVVY